MKEDVGDGEGTGAKLCSGDLEVRNGELADPGGGFRWVVRDAAREQTFGGESWRHTGAGNAKPVEQNAQGQG